MTGDIGRYDRREHHISLLLLKQTIQYSAIKYMLRIRHRYSLLLAHTYINFKKNQIKINSMILFPKKIELCFIIHTLMIPKRWLEFPLLFLSLPPFPPTLLF